MGHRGPAPDRFCPHIGLSVLKHPAVAAPDIAQITPAQVAAWAAAQHTRPLLLDVRQAWEVQTAHVSLPEADSLHMPMHSVPERLRELDTTRPVACLCHHGVRSQQVAYFLAQHGFEVVNIAGGIDAWALHDTRVASY